MTKKGKVGGETRKWMMWLACYHCIWRGMHKPFIWRWRRLVREMKSRSYPGWKRPSLMKCSQHTKKLTTTRWAGKHMNVFTNKIRQLIGLTRFEGAKMEWLTKLTFITEIRVFARSQKSVPPGTCPRITVAIPDNESWWEKILPDMFGIWSECDSFYNEGYHQHGVGSGRNYEPCSICLYR